MEAAQAHVYSLPREVVSKRQHTYHVKRKFGITAAVYDAMVNEQEGKCAICGRPPLHYRLSVDHDHERDIVRGLLCPRCNRGLGVFWDNPEMLRKAADYLEKF